MRKPATGLVSTRAFARRLLNSPDEFVRMWGFGRLWIVWDTNLPAIVPTADVFDGNPPDRSSDER